MKHYQSIRLTVLCLFAGLFANRASAQTANSSNPADTVSSVPFTMTVVLVEFDARSGSQGNQLSWSTILESNLAMYEIERSVSGKPFASIGTVKAKGSGSLKVQYQFTDTRPEKGTNIYRLKMVDIRGGVKYSDHKLVNGNLQSRMQTQFAAYPNPARGGQQVRMEVNITGNFMARIIGLQGKIVSTSRLDNMHGNALSVRIPQGLSAGIYMLELVQPESGQLFQQKLMIL